MMTPPQVRMPSTPLAGRFGRPLDVVTEEDWYFATTRHAVDFRLDEPAPSCALARGFDARLSVAGAPPSTHRCLPVQLTGGTHLQPAVFALTGEDRGILLCCKPEALAASTAAGNLLADHPIDASLILFDVDGTLVDSLPAYVKVGQLAAARYGFDMTEAFVRATMNRNNDAFWELVVPMESPNRDAIIADLKAEARRLWPELVSQMVRPFAGVEDCLRRLADSGYRLGVVTASSGRSMETLAPSIVALFDTVVTRHDVAAQKPAPDGIARALTLTATPQSDAIYVGDSAVDVQAATAAGVNSIAVTTGAGVAAELAELGPRRLIKKLGALPALLARGDDQKHDAKLDNPRDAT